MRANNHATGMTVLVRPHVPLPSPPLPSRSQVRLHYPGKLPSAVDIRYKTKLNDHGRMGGHGRADKGGVER